jgi:hypothetical protein
VIALLGSLNGDSRFVDKLIQDQHDSYTQCKTELESKFRGIEETKDDTMGDEGAHLKRSLDDTDSLDSDDMHDIVAAVNSSIN